MSRLALVRHPATPCSAVERIEVELGRDERGALRLDYRMTGAARAVVAAPLAHGERPQRRDGLWRHTCCELFIQDAAGLGYSELNFSPCGDWAAYRFGGYRAGQSPLDIAAPRIALERSALEIILTVTLADRFACALMSRRIAIACVVETTAALSYWALAHPPGRPDFHHPHGFAPLPHREHAFDPFG